MVPVHFTGKHFVECAPVLQTPEPVEEQMQRTVSKPASRKQAFLQVLVHEFFEFMNEAGGH